MVHTSRRGFLRVAAGTLGASAALASFPPAIRRALAIPAARETGTLQDVQHIVVLTQENRSFDHYFGTLNGVRGFADPFPIPLADRGRLRRKSVWLQPNANAPTPPGQPDTIAPFALNTARHFALMRVEGTPHAWPDAQAAWDHGRLSAWPRAKQNHAMGYFGAADLPFQFALANAFTLCDAYHCSAQAGTNTNRLFLFTGTNDPLRRGNGPATDNRGEAFSADPATDYTWTTYPERLQSAGISWQVYQEMADNFGDNPLVGFRAFRDAWYGRPGASTALKSRGVSTRGLALLRQDVLDGRLPQVSWIVATAEGSEHPGPSSPAQGADYTARVLDALTANPEVWARTVLFINFDENDGFFDHVPPPAAPSVQRWDTDPAMVVLAGASTVDLAGEYHEHLNGSAAATLHRPYGLGPRVPMLVVSPWSKGGWVNSQVADHTSVIRFIERRFGVAEPNIAPWRRAVCGDLSSALRFADPDPAAFFASLPATRARADRARMLPQRTTPPTPGGVALPVQAAGPRPSSALPYELAATTRVVRDGQPLDRPTVGIDFANTGEAGAVFHVYDRLRLADLPRRYTVEAGRQLADRWACDASGAYDLWVLGPNGFHRHATGHAPRTPAADQPDPEVVAQHDRGRGELVVQFVNQGGVDCSFQWMHNRYAAARTRRVTVAAGRTQVVRLPLAGSGHWYDVSVQVQGQPGFSRRFAGRVETGAASISDPAMQGMANADQWRA